MRIREISNFLKLLEIIDFILQKYSLNCSPHFIVQITEFNWLLGQHKWLIFETFCFPKAIIK